ncbi:MAG: carboxypeptidase-like regulatory domain-containing protein, partial [Candidatus Sulfotelmatobacter sp.]
MPFGSQVALNARPQSAYISALTFTFLFALSCRAPAQTASTGALTGLTFGPSGSIVAGVMVQLVNSANGKSGSTASDENGRFSFVLLEPGSYEVKASKVDFVPLSSGKIDISVTETRRLDIHLQLATINEQVQVSANGSTVQTDDSSLGRVVDGTALHGLPLVTRNLAQISALSPGVAAGVFNAGELGLGGMALSQIASSNDGIFVHGARSYDNNWQLDGISVSDVQGSGAGSGGIPIPNPDSLQEFKVQTALYDAAYGRYAGANVSVITKDGTDAYHGTVFEFLRNNVLNANDFFLNQVGQSRPSLKQNQFGFSIGGPIRKDNLFFFGSYQGTRQINGIAAGQARIGCTSSLISPPITNDRSRTALGRLFAGMNGALGGVAVESDGSNINPTALALLNLKLPDGSFLIPTPQTIDTSRPFDNEGSSILTEPCDFMEGQFLANADYVRSQKSSMGVRTFHANDSETITFPGNFFNPVPNIPGFASPNNSGYRVINLHHTYALNSTWINELRFGYVRTASRTQSHAPFDWSDIGVAEGDMNNTNALPNLNILGSVAFSSAFPLGFAQNSFVITEDLSSVHGAHTFHFGGSLTRLQDNFNDPGIGSFVQFLSWPDFLLGLNASSNGT